MKKLFSLFAAVLMAGSMMAAIEEIAVATFNGKGEEYTENWTTTGTGHTRTDCVVIGAGENITSPEMDLTEYSKVYVALSGRRFGSLSGSKATVNVAVNGVSIGTIDITATGVGPVADTLEFTPTADMTAAVLVVTCTNATSSGSSHGAGIGKISLLYDDEEEEEEEEEEEGEKEESIGELLCTLDFPSHNDTEISAYTETWTATVDGATWTLTAFNNNKNVWNLVKCGRKGVASVASIETPALKATVNTLIYDFAALPANSVDSAFIYALYQGEEQGKASVTLKAGKDTIATPVTGVKYSYKLEIYCKSASSNGPVQLSGVQVYGTPAQSAVADPVFDVAAGDYYDAQLIHLTCETEGAAILYTIDGTDPVLGSAAVYYPLQGIYVGESVTIKAIAYNNDSDNPQFSDVVEKTYVIAPAYDSFDELVNEAGTPAGQKVVVNFENVVIDSLYTTKAGKVNGVYLTAAGRMVEIYCYDVPAEWEVGGTISGVVKGEWKNYNGTWEVCPSSWDGITYKAVLPEGPEITVDLVAKKFSVTPANEEDIYLLLLMNSKTDGGLSEANALAIAEEYVEWISADYTLEEWVDGGEAYQGSLSDISLSLVGMNVEGTYALAACVVVENDATLHTAEIVSKITYVEFTISPATGIENVKVVEAAKTIVDGELVIVKDGVRYNALGARK